jgi:uncharacterized protein YlxW (UPF0749 family)
MVAVVDSIEIEETIYRDKTDQLEVRLRDTRQRITRLQTTVSTLQAFYDGPEDSA